MPKQIEITETGWLVTFHYNRGEAVVIFYPQSERKEMQRLVDISVFQNQDCVNVNIVKINV